LQGAFAPAEAIICCPLKLEGDFLGLRTLLCDTAWVAEGALHHEFPVAYISGAVSVVWPGLPTSTPFTLQLKHTSAREVGKPAFRRSNQDDEERTELRCESASVSTGDGISPLLALPPPLPVSSPLTPGAFMAGAAVAPCADTAAVGLGCSKPRLHGPQ